MNESAEPKSDRRCREQNPFAGFFRAMQPPAGATSHFRQAHIEFLKGVREIVDRRIENLTEGPQKGTRIHVD